MSGLEVIRAWLSVQLLLLVLALLIWPRLLNDASDSFGRELHEYLPAAQQSQVKLRGEYWRTLLGTKCTTASIPPEVAWAGNGNDAEVRPGALNQLLWQSQAWLQLICLRAALLLQMWPVLAVLLLASLLDGWVARRIRQTSFRPSSVLLHRLALTGLQAGSLGLLSYVLIPLPWPGWLLPLLLLALLLAARNLLAHAQKRL